MLKICFGLLAIATIVLTERVDYSGHKVLSVVPKTQEDLEFLHKLRSDYGIDLWNEPRTVGTPVLIHLDPNMITPVEQALAKRNIEYDVVFYDLQSTIIAEQVMNAPTNVGHAEEFDFGKYNQLSQVEALLKRLGENDIARLDKVGTSYENRPIYNLVIGSQPAGKPAIMMECGIHAREWSSVAACSYLVNKLVTEYETDPTVKALVDKYEFNVIVEANPDGYVYTWTEDRLWRKTRSHSSIDSLGICRGTDANRNFDIEHCGVGTSRKPCDEIYCGDKPFSESESRTIRDLMLNLQSRLKGYFSVHAFSQLWMTPYGTTKKLPADYSELERVSNAGITALAKKYGTKYSVGSIANIIYEAAGSSVDYAYEKVGIKMAFALELRDTGRFGFFLPQQYILPTCEETFDGLMAAVQAIN